LANLAFTAKLQSSRSELVWLLNAVDKDKACWYYLQVEKTKLQLFKAKLKTGKFKLTDYGKILYSGWGEKPAESIRQKIREQFG